MKKTILTICAILVGSMGTMNAQKLQTNNVDEILKAMTLEEKATIYFSDILPYVRPTHYRTRGGEWRGCIAATSHYYMLSVIR